PSTLFGGSDTGNFAEQMSISPLIEATLESAPQLMQSRHRRVFPTEPTDMRPSSPVAECQSCCPDYTGQLPDPDKMSDNSHSPARTPWAPCRSPLRCRARSR